MLSAPSRKITIRVQSLMAISIILLVSLMLSLLTTTSPLIFIFYQPAKAQMPIGSTNGNNNNSNSNTTTFHWLTYENQTFGIKLQYPSNWKKIDEDKNTIRFSPLLKNNDNTTAVVPPPVSLLIQASPSQNLALEDLVSLDLIKYRQNFSDFRLIDSGATRLAGNAAAYKAVFHYKKGLDIFISTQLWTVIGDRTFVVNYTVSPNKYSVYLPTVQSMINSLKFDGIQSTAPGEASRLALIGLKIGTDPYYLTMNTITKKIYVANYRDDTVSVIDSLNDRVEATIVVGNCPDAIAVNEVTNMIYVANDCSNSVSVIDGAKNKAEANIGVGKNPEDVLVDQKEGGFDSLIFIANYGSNTVSVIDGQTNRVIGNMGVGDKPSALAINHITNRLYVVNSDSNRIDVIDYFTMKKDRSFKPSVISNITVGTFPNSIYLNSDVNTLYVSNRHSNSVSVIDGTKNKVIGNIGVGSTPYHVDGNPITNKIYVANYGSNTVSVIDGTKNKVIGSIIAGYLPYSLYVNPSSDIIYVTNLGSNTVSEINGTINKILIGVTFSVEPKDGGYIRCNNLYGSNMYVRFEIGKNLDCEAIPAPNYRFSSWSGSSLTSNLVDVNNPNIKLNLSRHGTLTPHFIVPVNISIPAEYFASLYGIVLGIILPPLAGLYFVRRARRNLGKYMKEIDKVYDTLHQDGAKSLQRLTTIRADIIRALEKGYINESHYSILESRISKYIDEVGKSE